VFRLRMLHDVMENQAKTSADSGQELEGREGVEDFGYSPLWPKPPEPSEKDGPAGAASAPPQLTLTQALDLLEVETAKRRLAEQGLQEREERFRQMTRYLGKFLWLSDATTNKLIYVSPGYEQVWHTKREACYQQAEDWLDDTPPEAEGSCPAGAGKSDKGDKGVTDYQAVGPDGSLRWIRERMYPIQDATGKTLYILGIAEDITDLKSLEAAFQEGQVMKRSFLRVVPDTLLKVRQDGTILEFKAAKDDPQLRPTLKLKGKNFNSLLPEATARQAMHSIQRALSTGRTQVLLLEYTVGGVPRIFEVRQVACGQHEVLVLARDVTGLKAPA
jgi:PAS domain S-box-containing protein